MAAVATCKSRLFVGEGNFSYTEALLSKHSKIEMLAHAIIATEYRTEDELPERTMKRIVRLREKRVEVLLGVDATILHETFRPGVRFKRIHWNCPHLGGRDFSLMRGTIAAFFQSAAHLQEDGDRIHITLNKTLYGSPGDPAIHELHFGYYGIAKAALAGRYRLIKVRKFNDERYAGYRHTTTKSSSVTPKQLKYSGEFIFRKEPEDTDLYSREEDLPYIDMAQVSERERIFYKLESDEDQPIYVYNYDYDEVEDSSSDYYDDVSDDLDGVAE